MARNVAKNASGKYLRMNDDQITREQERFERAVERQREKNAAKAAESRRKYPHVYRNER